MLVLILGIDIKGDVTIARNYKLMLVKAERLVEDDHRIFVYRIDNKKMYRLTLSRHKLKCHYEPKLFASIIWHISNYITHCK